MAFVGLDGGIEGFDSLDGDFDGGLDVALDGALDSCREVGVYGGFACCLEWLP